MPTTIFENTNAIWEIAKYPVLFALGLYIVFAIVIVRQVKIMTDTLSVGFEWQIILISWAHLLLALGMFAVALVML